MEDQNLTNNSSNSKLEKPIQQAQGKPKEKKKPTILIWALITTFVVIISLILIFWGNCTPWWLVLILMLDFLLLLIINYLNKLKTKKMGWLFGLFLAIMPVLVLVFVGAWTWWMWVLAIGLYVFTLAVYFMGLLLENYWRVVVPLSIFLILMLIFISI